MFIPIIINFIGFIGNKYFISPNRTGYPIGSERQEVTVDYYPWILLIFFAQAILFLIPHWIWESFNYKTGITLRSLAIGLTVNDNKARKVMGKNAFDFDFDNAEPLSVFFEVLKYNSNNRTDKVFGKFIKHKHV